MSFITLKGEKVFLRALEPEDLEFVHKVENDENIWHLSSTQTPFSRFVIRQYLENAGVDIYEAKQLRLAVCISDNQKAVGLIDLYDFDPKNSRAGVGIVIYDTENRHKGYGSEALRLLVNYAFSHLNLHQLHASIEMSNEASISLFTALGFEFSGIRKEWNFQNGNWVDEGFYQLLKLKM